MRTTGFLVFLLCVTATEAFAQDTHLIVSVTNFLGFPMDGVRIEVSLKSSRTVVASGITVFGSATIRVAPSRTYIVRAATQVGFLPTEPHELSPLPGDVATSFRLVEDEGVPLDTEGIRIPQPRKGLLSGRILSTEGLPLAGIQVDYRSADWAQSGGAKTAADGSYRFAVQPGTYWINSGGDLTVPHASTSSETFVVYGRVQHSSVIVSSGRETRVPPILLPPIQLFNVTVTVTDGAGQLVPDAAVSFTVRREGNGVSHSIKGTRLTDAKGSAMLGPLSPGRVDIMAQSRRGTRDVAAAISLDIQEAPEEVSLLLLPAARLTGRVEFVDRLNPLQTSDGLHVRSSLGRSGRPVPDPEGLVGPDGEFTLTGLIGQPCLVLSGIPDGWRLLDITYLGTNVTHRQIVFQHTDDVSGVLIRVEPGDSNSDEYVRAIPPSGCQPPEGIEPKA